MDENKRLIIKNSYNLAQFKPDKRKELVIRGLNALAENRDADFYFFKGEEHRIKKEYNKAISCYEKALQIDPEYKDARFHLGLAYYCRGLYAVETIRRLIKVSRHLLQELGREPTVQEIAENMKIPAKKVRKILELGQKSISLEARIGKEKDSYFGDFIKKDDEDSAIENFRKAAQKNPQDAGAFFLLGMLYYEKGDYERAIEAYQENIRIIPDNSSIIYNNLGWTYGELEKYQEAVDAFKEAVKQNPENADFHYGLGWVYNELKDYKKAVESYKQAILIQPGHTYAHYGLGMIYLVQGHRNSAVKEYEILKDLDRDTADKLFNTIYKNFRKATQENPQHADAFFYLGWLHNKKGNYEKTVEAYQEVIRINPDYTYIYYNLGWAYTELEKYQEAVDAFKEAVKQNPEDADAHYGLGWTYSQLKDYGKAVESFKQAILIQPGHTYAHYGLGLIYFAQGYKNAALGEYKILKDLDKNISEDLFNMIYK